MSTGRSVLQLQTLVGASSGDVDLADTIAVDIGRVRTSPSTRKATGILTDPLRGMGRSR